jgi:RND family efflux transporter MFP subunit
VESLRKNIGIIQKQAALMTVTAPSSGVVDQLNVRVGEAFMGATAMGPQISIVNTNDLKIVTQVPENYLDKVNVGSQLEVHLPETNRTVNTKVSVVSKIIDPASRTFYIEAKIPADAKLKPNQIAVVKIKDYAAREVITIPVNTLQNDEKGKYVIVAAKENGRMIARKRQVMVGQLHNDQLEVKSGLQSGDVLVTEGFQGLYEGQLLTTPGS